MFLLGSDAPILIVDDDPAVRDTLALLLKLEGFSTRSFADGAAFLDAVPHVSPACVILDLKLPGCSGLTILRRLADEGFAAPVIVISGQSDITLAVEAMKLGAVDFLEKPFPAQTMIDRVRDAVDVYRRAMADQVDGLADFPGRHLLTRREREVLAQVARGASNKEAGRRLGISPRTVEVHRARVMEKLGARNAADLMRIVLSEVPARPALRMAQASRAS